MPICVIAILFLYVISEILNHILASQLALLIVLLGFILFAILIPLFIFFEKRMWKNMYYVITPDSLLIKNTIFGEKQESFSLRGITSINCQQDFIPKILGYGNITIHFFGEASVTIKNIEEPGLTMSRVQELVNTGIIEDNNV